MNCWRGTIIYFDPWEDGYETNVANSTQGTTQIWDDGVLTNGIAPGTSNDLINAGTVLVLSNAVNTNVPVMTDSDGGDKIGATKTVATTRIGWASASSTLVEPLNGSRDRLELAQYSFMHAPKTSL